MAVVLGVKMGLPVEIVEIQLSLDSGMRYTPAPKFCLLVLFN